MNKNLEKEYKNYIDAGLPDLWSRIEASLPEKNNDSQNVSNKIDSSSKIYQASINGSNNVYSDNVNSENGNNIEKISFRNDITEINNIEKDNKVHQKKKNIKPIIITLSGVAAAALLILTLSPVLKDNTASLQSAQTNRATATDCADSAVMYESEVAGDENNAGSESIDGNVMGATELEDSAASKSYSNKDVLKSDTEKIDLGSDETLCYDEEKRENSAAVAEAEEASEECDSEDCVTESSEEEGYEYGESVTAKVISTFSDNGCVFAEIYLAEGLGDVFAPESTIIVDATDVIGDYNQETLDNLNDSEVNWFVYLENDIWYASDKKIE